ncbi:MULTISPECIES: hypothetical protein [Bacillus amyloliquefaciens group]|uniref:hypothetical protein n=1 Tax=Bacillus amyloliquefaciens group TaxID=1938374 RepID=UPI000CA218B8|nr:MULTISPECIES: hypothetical protein [Bacillus amyloliquefaciens group]ATX84215.1 hypothetical protein CU084_11220 [Bacillus velezensis]KAF1274301.1 hypothetical protein BUE72_17265 [Bacillus amyloliquefaciens]MCM3278207.1 hypothetical protein [Bacillus velezensis]MCM3351327.1 hypothetical protein [Bacillus velezensis]MCO6398324.1 hypothetical protein [Bacillus velezensis]
MEWLYNLLQLSAVGGIVGTVSGALINRASNAKLQKMQTEINTNLEKLKIYENQSALKKSEQIEKLWKIFLDILKEKKMPREQELNNLYFKVFLYAPDETVRKFIKWKEYAAISDPTEESKKKALYYFAEFIVSYREELGQLGTNVTADDLLRIFLTDYEDYYKEASVSK